MTFHRHFVERNDFVTKVVTNSRHLGEHELSYTPIYFEDPAWWRRIKNTRLHRWVMALEQCHGSWLLPRHVGQAAHDFRPDVIFTMAGSWNWTALAARSLARKLGVPLVASFNDWFDYPSFSGPPSLHRAVETRFRRFYREADLALCTSEGMRDELGHHQNAHVWYPTGAVMPHFSAEQDCRPLEAGESFNVLFGGNLGEWYGTMLESLVACLRSSRPGIAMRIFGSNASWSADFENDARESGIFGGRIGFDELRTEAARSDLLLLPMGFDASCAHVERTSFKTKFLDYLTFHRPILIWGPDYCSAVRTARQYDSAECVTDPDPMVCAAAMVRLRHDPRRRKELVDNANRMYHDRFHPDKIHAVLVEGIGKLLEQKSAQ